jgi:hypothetical protein
VSATHARQPFHARHADPGTTMRYGRARKNPDRHPNYIPAAYMTPEPSGHDMRICRIEYAVRRPTLDLLCVEVFALPAVHAAATTATPVAERVGEYAKTRFDGGQALLLY